MPGTDSTPAPAPEGQSQAMTYTPKAQPGQAMLAAPQVVTNETAATAVAAHAKAMIEARYTIALAKPRNLDTVFQRLEKECGRPTFAQVAIYHKPVGDGLEGLSVRFAEAALAAMGNIVIETPTLYDDPDKRIVRVSVLDLETNTGYSKDITFNKLVERRHLAKDQVALSQRYNSRGYIVYTVKATDDEILNTENALVSKALRTLGLRLVPGWIQDQCKELIYAKRADENKKDPDATRRKLLAGLLRLGVNADQVRDYLGHDTSTMTDPEYNELLGLGVAIKDGETTWREAMDGRQPKAEDAAAGAQPAATTPPAAGGAPAAPAPVPPTPTRGTAGVKARITKPAAPKTMTMDTPAGPLTPEQLAAKVGTCDKTHVGDPCADPQCWLTTDGEPAAKK